MTDIRILITQAKLEVAKNEKEKTIQLTKALAGLQSNIREREREAAKNSTVVIPNTNQSVSPSKG